MPKPIQVGRKERMTFAKINEVCEMPNLIQIQTDSYKWFIEEGLREVFEFRKKFWLPVCRRVRRGKGVVGNA